MFFYQAYGVCIKSELEFPDIPVLNHPCDTTDFITIRRQSINQNNKLDPQSKGLFYQIYTDEVWLNIPLLGAFIVSKGNEIAFDEAFGLDSDTLRECILGICLPVLLLQRNNLVLQGNIIKKDNFCFALVGLSGAGKSALTAAFFKQGYKVLSDDFFVIDEKLNALPGIPFLKLWFDTLKILDLDLKNIKPIRPCLKKFNVPLFDQFHEEPLPLKAIYVMHTDQKDEYIYESIVGTKKIVLLQNCIPRKNYITNYRIQFIKQITELAKNTTMVQVTRPQHEFKFNDCIGYIEQQLEDIKSLYG